MRENLNIMGPDIGEAIKTYPFYDSGNALRIKKLQWSSLRLMFIICTVFSTTIVVVGCLFSPVFSYCFFGDFRPWRYLRLWPRLLVYVYYLLYLSLKGESAFSTPLPLTAPPMSAPKLNPIQIHPDWPHGLSCDSCSKCCSKIRCPLLEKTTGKCKSYNSFYWRYFNCGRYPENQADIDRFECPKWMETPSGETERLK